MAENSNAEIPVVILCGGQGTRIREVAERLPKPLVDIGGQPILWHIMKLYNSFGFRRFILCLGYKSSEIKGYFLRYRETLSDFTVVLNEEHRPDFHNAIGDEDWEITCVETGLLTGTGGRIGRIERYIDTDTFMLTYGDGLGDVDIGALLAFHRQHGRIGTVTGVRPTSRFGELSVDGHVVTDFNEKPSAPSSFVSGGFFAFNRSFFKYLSSDENLFLENEPLRRLASDGELGIRPHEGFWMGMDTFREYTQLNDLWVTGQAPWKLWKD
jgi:glucose-1-phosphate cytidylyltransferase